MNNKLLHLTKIATEKMNSATRVFKAHSNGSGKIVIKIVNIARGLNIIITFIWHLEGLDLAQPS